jgi:hypothetical protein
MEVVHIALDKRTDAATAIADDSNKIHIYVYRKMVFETSTQFCVVNVCRETERGQSAHEWRVEWKVRVPANKDAGFVGQSVSLNARICGRCVNWSNERRISGRCTSSRWVYSR